MNCNDSFISLPCQNKAKAMIKDDEVSHVCAFIKTSCESWNMLMTVSQVLMEEFKKIRTEETFGLKLC